MFDNEPIPKAGFLPSRSRTRYDGWATLLSTCRLDSAVLDKMKCPVRPDAPASRSVPEADPLSMDPAIPRTFPAPTADRRSLTGSMYTRRVIYYGQPAPRRRRARIGPSYVGSAFCNRSSKRRDPSFALLRPLVFPNCIKSKRTHFFGW